MQPVGSGPTAARKVGRLRHGDTVVTIIKVRIQPNARITAVSGAYAALASPGARAAATATAADTLFGDGVLAASRADYWATPFFAARSCAIL